MKVKEAVPNCLISKETLVKEGPESESKEGPESKPKSIVSGDERSTEIAVSSPVIRVYGSVGVEATLETTEVSKADRINPYGA